MVRYIKASSDGGVTTNLAEFGNRELAEVRDLLTAMIDEGLPEDFDRDGTVPAFNKSSGSVFLTNSEYQVCMINPNTGSLESWYFTPYSGYEGFLDDLVEMYQDDPESWNEDDIEYLRELGAGI